ncbi:hypothetical protein MANES_17G057000v8 [Manihot esculenta]|uniref:DNA 3'-5' helicase n=1 Tax=Manihot esculenta TaxID=3983 RepID=A0A2C9U7Z9_MANES|nr:hypothetical protein MANES_17G057000v8 [Manihot esculenta]
MDSNDDHNQSERCFLDWMKLQEVDLGELRQALTLKEKNESLLVQIVEKVFQHFQDYVDKRAQLAHNYVSLYFAPSWNSSLENSMLWLAGCRPSSFIRLLYALCGSEVNSHLTEYIEGRKRGDLGDLSSNQLNMVNNLQSKTVKQEEKLTSKLASLQEDLADEPISIIAQRTQTQITGELNEEVERALKDQDEGMMRVMKEADNLRLNTLKELLFGILTPVQAVEYLAASKKLHLCMHEWGKTRDQMHGGRSNY